LKLVIIQKDEKVDWDILESLELNEYLIELLYCAKHLLKVSQGF